MSPILAIMIDSIHLYNNITSSQLETLLSCLKNKRKEVLMDTGEIRVSATLRKSITVLVRGNYVYIRGSLAKFYKQSGSSLLWNEISLAIQALQDKLGIELWDFNISRLDLEGTFPVPKPVKTYYEYLGEATYLTRSITGNSLYYKNENRTLCFYDKGAKNRKDYGRSRSTELNLMRFEVRYFRRFIKQIIEKLAIDSLILSDLLDLFIQQKMSEFWLKEFEGITKHPEMSFELSKVNGVRDFRKRVESKAIQDLGGVSKVIEMLNRSRSPNLLLNSKNLSKIKSYLKSLSSDPLLTMHSSHLQELDYFIATTYVYNLLCISENKKLN